MTAEDYYKLGNSYRKKGDFKHAIDSYNEAIALDPNSPAVEAKKMLEMFDYVVPISCTFLLFLCF